MHDKWGKPMLNSTIIPVDMLLATTYCGIMSKWFTWTLDIHEVAVGTLNKPLKFVLSFFFFHRGMQKIFEQLSTK